jgi:hypothetical protein
MPSWKGRRKVSPLLDHRSDLTATKSNQLILVWLSLRQEIGTHREDPTISGRPINEGHSGAHVNYFLTIVRAEDESLPCPLAISDCPFSDWNWSGTEVPGNKVIKHGRTRPDVLPCELGSVFLAAKNDWKACNFQKLRPVSCLRY